MNLPLFSAKLDSFNNSSDPVVIEAIREAEDEKSRFLIELEHFLETNKQKILPKHIKYIEKKLEKKKVICFLNKFLYVIRAMNSFFN